MVRVYLLAGLILAMLLGLPAATAYVSYGPQGTYGYNAYGISPSIQGYEYRPEGYGLVRAYSRHTFVDDNLFLGHRSSWDGRSAFYSAYTGQQRIAPMYRVANPRYQPIGGYTSSPRISGSYGSYGYGSSHGYYR